MNSKHDKRPDMVFRVGVIGNRDLGNVDKKMLEHEVVRVFRLIRTATGNLKDADSNSRLKLYSDAGPQYVLIDALAEGVDQLVAQVAIQPEFSYHVRCPIPFPEDVYKRNFRIHTDESIRTYEHILSTPESAAVSIEMDCSQEPGQRGKGYKAAAGMLLEHADLVIAVFDPERDGAEGGTRDSFAEAMRRKIPVIRIDVMNPQATCLISHSPDGAVRTAEASAGELQNVLRNVYAPAFLDTRKHGVQVTRLQRFYNEPFLGELNARRIAAITLHGAYSLFWKPLPVIAGIFANFSPRKSTQNCPDPAITALDEVDRDTLRHLRSMQGLIGQRQVEVDRLATIYMEIYRGSFVHNFILGALAVSCALLSHFTNYQIQWLLGEMTCLLLILLTYIFSNRLGWHERAVDYRFIAEFLRHAKMLSLLGRPVPIVRAAPHYRQHDPVNSWMYWYVEALDRDMGPFGITRDSTHSARRVIRLRKPLLQKIRSILCEDWLRDQCNYHRDVVSRLANVGLLLRIGMITLFALTSIAVFIHLYHIWAHPYGQGDPVTTILAAASPAFLAALHGISVQGEFERIKERSEATAEYLEGFINTLGQVMETPEQSYSVALSEQALRAAQVMLEEVVDWRIIYQVHSVELT